ncbi:hypothetical protein D922_01829 [Enterococcus faecalis 06-MB-DW-09]|nr:hypothetical protein D922_01829 [Enterococcus faecalis 06-MB-DW-09]
MNQFKKGIIINMKYISYKIKHVIVKIVFFLSVGFINSKQIFFILILLSINYFLGYHPNGLLLTLTCNIFKFLINSDHSKFRSIQKHFAISLFLAYSSHSSKIY